MEQLNPGGQAAARKRQRKDNGNGTAIVPVSGVAPAAVIRLDPEMLIAKGIEHGISVEGLERLLAMRERLKAEQARSAYVHAVAQFQGGCPIITKQAVVRDKVGKERYRYASMEAIVKQVGPLLRASDLTYRIDTRIEEGQAVSSPAPSGGGWVGVSLVAICIITHRDGHSESSEFRVPIDRDSYMSEPQKFGAASTYAKRYAFCNALGILTGDQDNDAVGAAPRGRPSQGTHGGVPLPETLSPAQLAELRSLMRQAGADEGRFCSYLKIKSVAELEASRFEPACQALRKKLGRGVAL